MSMEARMSVERVTRVFILRMHSLGQNRPLRPNTVFAVARIEGKISVLVLTGVTEKRMNIKYMY